MKFSDLKYLLAYITPAIAWVSLTNNGWWSYATLIFMFGLVPVLDILLPASDINHKSSVENSRLSAKFFDFLLYLNLPIVFILVIKYFSLVAAGTMGTSDFIGNTLTTGLVAGALGINVAHEIGHRPEKYNQWISRFLLLPSLYLHFNIEHNRGHHKNVATLQDPATSRYGENFYSFWFRTVFGSIKSAWNIESSDTVKQGYSKFTMHNQMIQFVLIQLTYLLIIAFFFGPIAAGMAVLVGILGFTLLESVNYIEHYGLMRKLLPSGRYEPVQEHHSWNSDHFLGRILLYELTRHSDHHFKATRKYQTLRHFDESPQMPLGYPGSMLIALIPPLWFGVMHRQEVLRLSNN